jgi:hypothetical protein
MATYLDGGVDFVPQETPFTPNYDLIVNTLQYKQNLYDKGFAQIKNTVGNIISSDLTNPYSKQLRTQLLSNAEQQLKNLSNLDLGLSQNVATANSLFRPFYDNDYIIKDYTFTKGIKSEMQKGMSYRSSEKEEQRNRYWNEGVEYLQNKLEDFANASPDEMMGKSVEMYTSKPQTYEKVMKLFSDGKLKVATDRVGENGEVLYTDENGNLMKTPLTNLYLALAQNDPEAMSGYRVYGSVMRTRFAKSAVETGQYANIQEAYKAVDSKMVDDHKSLLKRQMDLTENRIKELQIQIDKWNAGGATSDPVKVKQQIADKLEYESLKNSKIDLQNKYDKAQDNIMSNPEARMGEIYLHKSASDLAEALSEFGTRKIGINPLYEKLKLPFILEQYKSDLEIARDNNRAANELTKLKYEKQLDDLYGTGGGSSKSEDGTTKTEKAASATRSALNVPTVTTTGSTSASLDGGNLPNAYQQNIDSKRTIIERFSDEKLNFIEAILGGNMVNPDTGKPLTTAEKTGLLRNGSLLDKLYAQANKEFDAMVKVGNPDDNAKIIGARISKYKADNLHKVWLASDDFMKKHATNVLSSLKTQKQANGKEGNLEILDFMFDENLGRLLNGNNEEDKKLFLSKLKKSDAYKKTLGADIVKKASQGTFEPVGGTYIPGVTPVEIESDLDKSYLKLFKKYSDDAIETWNKEGYHFVTQNDALMGKGGGGITGKSVTFYASSDVRGEKADEFAEDLITKITPLRADSEAVKVISGSNPPGGEVNNDEAVRELFFNTVGSEIMKNIKLGKGANLKDYSLQYSPVGSNNPDYNAYVISLDSDYISKNTSSEGKNDKLFTNEQGRALANGMTVYVKKDKDTSKLSRDSQLGEVEYLLRMSNTGTMSEEVMPGYSVKVTQQPRGNYVITVKGKRYKKDNPADKEPFSSADLKDYTQDFNVASDTDLTYYYYNIIQDLFALQDMNQTMSTNLEKSQKTKQDVKIYTPAEIDELVKKMGSGQNVSF